MQDLKSLRYLHTILCSDINFQCNFGLVIMPTAVITCGFHSGAHWGPAAACCISCLHHPPDYFPRNSRQAEDADAGLPSCKGGISLEHVQDWKVQEKKNSYIWPECFVMCITRASTQTLNTQPRLCFFSAQSLSRGLFRCFCWPNYSI